MWVERRFIETCSPQNLQRAFPGDIWTLCIPHQHACAVVCASSTRGNAVALRAKQRGDASRPGIRRRALALFSNVAIQPHDRSGEVVRAD